MSGDQSPFPPPVVIFHKTFGNSVSQCVNFLRTGSKIAKSTKRHATTKRTKHAKDSEIIHFNFLLRALRDLRGKQNQVDNASLPIKKPQELDFRKSITPILHFSIAYVCFFSLLASAFLMI
jgi:hypothetical protein